MTQTFPVLSSSQIRWSVTAAFEDGGSASGYFVLDTSNATIPDWDIVATGPGNVILFPPRDIPPFEFDPETSNANSGSASAQLIFQSYPVFPCYDPAGGQQSVAFESALASVPTGAGGTISIEQVATSQETILCEVGRLITSGLITTLSLTNPPSFSPAPGSYTSNQTVTITDSTPNSTIYYTTDGSLPTSSSSVYSGPISVGQTDLIQSIATASGHPASAVASANYTINLPPSFTIGANPGSLTLASGSQGEITLTVAPQHGFGAAVTFACSGLPPGATCAFNPSSVTPSASSITTQLTIATSASASNAHPAGYPFSPGAILAVVCCVLVWRKRRLVVWSTSAFLLSGCLFAISACGGGGSSGGSNPPPPTTATVTVTATSGSLVQTATISLTITH